MERIMLGIMLAAMAGLGASTAYAQDGAGPYNQNVIININFAGTASIAVTGAETGSSGTSDVMALANLPYQIDIQWHPGDAYTEAALIHDLPRQYDALAEANGTMTIDGGQVDRGTVQVTLTAQAAP